MDLWLSPVSKATRQAAGPASHPPRWSGPAPGSCQSVEIGLPSTCRRTAGLSLWRTQPNSSPLVSSKYHQHAAFVCSSLCCSLGAGAAEVDPPASPGTDRKSAGTSQRDRASWLPTAWLSLGPPPSPLPVPGSRLSPSCPGNSKFFPLVL